MQKTELTLSAAREALRHIPSDDRELWVRIGMALKDEFGESAREDWLLWSESAPNFRLNDALTVWKSLKLSGAITIGSFIHEAKSFGWKPGKKAYAEVSPEQYAAREADRVARREDHQRQQDMQYQKASDWAVRIWESGIDCDSHGYLTKKGILPHGTKIIPHWERKITDTDTGEISTISFLRPLVIPLWESPKKIASLQFIFEESIEEFGRDKDYLPGGKKQGCYFKIGSISKNTDCVIVCEGFATGASIHQATGHPVMVAFDAGNLEAVALKVRGMLPDVGIIIAGDNDLWTNNNPGARKANAAAWAINGSVALPVFEDYSDKPTDFNDLRDPAMIADQINQSIPAVDPVFFSPKLHSEEPKPEVLASQSTPEQDDEISQKFSKEFFTIKGFDHDDYYVLQHEKMQLIKINRNFFNEAGFLQLADANFWEREFPDKTGWDKKAAINWFYRVANKKGIFNPSHVRGRGAWNDRDKLVIHMGEYLFVNGEERKIYEHDSKYVYQLSEGFPNRCDIPLTKDEGAKIIDIAKSFRWTKPASAPLLLGWIVLAPFCGALKWRPHIWLVGGAGSGKSSILTEFCHPLLNGMSCMGNGASSEAGFRQQLNGDALPILFDESEKNDDKEKARIDSILGMIRQSSSDSVGKTFKGTTTGKSMSFDIKSMFCLASIQCGIRNQADFERMSILNLRGKREGDNSAESWAELQGRINNLIRDDETIGSRLFTRTLRGFDDLRQNIKIFRKAAAKKFGSQRDGDQFGTLMAGACSLLVDGVVTPQTADAFLDMYEWEEFTEYLDTDDSTKALTALLSAHIRIDSGHTVTVHELILASRNIEVSGLSLIDETAKAILMRYGIKVNHEFVMFATNIPELSKLIKDSPYTNDLKSLLKRLPDARVHSPVAFAGKSHRPIAIPIQPLLEGYGLVGDFEDSAF